MRRARAAWAAALLAALAGGCLSVTQETTYAAGLQQAMAANHKAALALFAQMNTEMEPYLAAQAAAGTQATFSKADLTLLSADDIGAWDKTLTGLDNYCAALEALASGKPAADVSAACESFGKNIQSIATAEHASASMVRGAGVGLAALADLLIREKAAGDAAAVAKEADPHFQDIVSGLIAALGYAGKPPAPARSGIQETYEASYRSATLGQRRAEFPGDTIAGFASMGADERKAKVADFQKWLGAERDHDDFVAGLASLAAALQKAAAAHASLAGASPATRAQAFADLKAEISNVQAISSKFKS